MSRIQRSPGDRVAARPRPTTGAGTNRGLGGRPARAAASAMVASAMLVLAACGNSGGSAPGSPGSAPTGGTVSGAPAPSGSAPASEPASAGPGTSGAVGGPGSDASSAAAALSATGWKLTGLQSSGTTTPVDPTLNGWVRFAPAADGVQVAFNTSCNSGGGAAGVTGDGSTPVTGELDFGPQRATLIYCDGPSGTTETVMLSLFQGPRAYTLDPVAGTLSIAATDGSAGMSFTADPTVGADAFDDAPAAPSGSSGPTG